MTTRAAATVTDRGALDRSADVLEIVQNLGGSASAKQIKDALGLSDEPTHRFINRAIDKGLIRHVGKPHTQSARYVATALVEQVVPDLSQRDTILAILRDEGEVEDDRELSKLMAARDERWRTLGTHSLDHQLFSMKRSGLITFRKTNEGRVQRLTRIALAEQRAAGGTLTNELVEIGPDETVIPVPQAILEDGPSVMEPIMDVVLRRYPLLTSLRERALRRDETNRRVDAYLVAASALESVDRDESERLMALADQISVEPLSPVEVEYMRYAADHEEDENA